MKSRKKPLGTFFRKVAIAGNNMLCLATRDRNRIAQPRSPAVYKQSSHTATTARDSRLLVDKLLAVI